MCRFNLSRLLVAVTLLALPAGAAASSNQLLQADVPMVTVVAAAELPALADFAIRPELASTLDAQTSMERLDDRESAPGRRLALRFLPLLERRNGDAPRLTGYTVTGCF